MKIRVNSVAVEYKATSKGGKYGKLSVKYNNGEKDTEKYLVSFGTQEPAYKVLNDAKPGEVYEVEEVKNQQGYMDWINAVKGKDTDVPKQNVVSTSPTPKSTYETADERAKRQKLIVRQSSLSSAIEMLQVGKKGCLEVPEVLSVAKVFYDWVFETYPMSADEKAINAITQMDDDIPF